MPPPQAPTRSCLLALMETLCAHTPACSSRIHTKGCLTSSTIAITPTTLRVRLLLAVVADPDRVWQAVRAEIARLLADHRLDHVTVQRAEEPPEQSPGGAGGY